VQLKSSAEKNKLNVRSAILDEEGGKNAVRGRLYLSLSVYEPFGNDRRNSGTIGI